MKTNKKLRSQDWFGRKDKDGTYELVYQSSNVLIKRGNLWKAISSHTSGDKIIRTNQK